MINVDLYEFQKFSDFVYCWWDLNVEFKLLYDLNLVWFGWIDVYVYLVGKCVFDIGCGGGILFELMVGFGVQVKGIDLLIEVFGVVDLYSFESGILVDYEVIVVEVIVVCELGIYDVVICMEMFEYVLLLGDVVVVCVMFVKLGGWVFFLMLNCNLKFYLFVVIGVEYIV